MDLAKFIESKIQGKGRATDLVAARASIARYMRKEGCTYEDIGHFLKRDHTTIMYYLNEYQIPQSVTVSESDMQVIENGKFVITVTEK